MFVAQKIETYYPHSAKLEYFEMHSGNRVDEAAAGPAGLQMRSYIDSVSRCIIMADNVNIVYLF